MGALKGVLALVAVTSLPLASLSCQSSARQASLTGAPHPSPSLPPSFVAPSSVESYYPPHAVRQVGTAMLFLPGSAREQRVNFETLDGQAILEGDILLGPATALPFRYGIPWQSSLDTKSAVAMADRAYLWENGKIPYVIDASARAQAPAITWAVQHFVGTGLDVRPRAATDRDYVVFKNLGAACSSYLGRQGGPQDIDVSGCAPGSIVHELMHAAGFYHEQSRGDRDQYISIAWDEISPEMRFNFEKRDGRSQDIGPYDYGSIMHYPSHAGSKSGNPTIVPRQAGVRIGQRDGLSALDRSAIASLYRTSARSSEVALPPSPAPPVLTPSAPRPAPVPVAPSPVSLPPAPTPAQAPSAAPAGSFAGSYSSARGNVSCTQGGVFAQCQYPGGTLLCAANGQELACTWSGGGQGRASFRRQSNGVLAGTFGDGFSADSRGRWDLVPLQPSGTAQPAPAAPPPTAPASVPSAPAVSLSGNYTSTRGAMACVDSGSSVSCNFQEPDGVSGRLDCTKNQTGLELACGWITFLPRPGTGRAAFRRLSSSERRLTGSWGHFLAPSGGGTWDLQGQ